MIDIVEAEQKMSLNFLSVVKEETNISLNSTVHFSNEDVTITAEGKYDL